MKKILILLISLCIVQSTISATFKELQVIPYDTTNAQSMKIWFPVRAENCDVKLSILDQNYKQVRLLIKQSIRNGYYNIYWDKKDDSGRFVQEGMYKVATISCDYKRLEPITVSYTSGENLAYITANDDIQNPSVTIQLLDDSLHLSIDVLNRVKNYNSTIVSDSLTLRGDVTFNWVPSEVTPTGNYYYKVKVNNFEQLIPFKYKK